MYFEHFLIIHIVRLCLQTTSELENQNLISKNIKMKVTKVIEMFYFLKTF